MRHHVAPGFASVLLMGFASPSVAQEIGIASCDAFLKTYTTCIAANVPEAQQGQMRAVLEQLKTNWKAVAADAAGKAQLDGVCKQTTESIKQQTAALGCKW